MIGLALWAFAAAYGRVTRHLNFLPFLVLIGISIVVTLFTASAVPMSMGLQLGVNLAGFLLFFMAGHWIGRWLDRDKYYDE